MKLKPLLATALAALLCLSACSGADPTLGFDIRAVLGTYDPQLACGESALLIIENCFEGLLKKDENGEIAGGVAETWEVSEDGLRYTFALRDNLFWSDGQTPLTADDFVFAFRRLFEKETGAPLRADFIALSGAREILYEDADVSRLGVFAPDAGTVVIELAYPDALFPELLTTAAASPCSEAFFESTRGRYGQNLDYILFNGPYYVRRESASHYVLSPNPNHPGGGPFYQDIYVYVRDEADYDPLARLTEEKIDGAAVGYADLSELSDGGFHVDGSEDTLWMLLFNQEDEYFASKNIRRAFAYAADKGAMQAALPGNLRVADAYVPGAVTVGGASYREQAGDRFVGFDYDGALAKELLKDGLAELGREKLPTLTILCPGESLGAMGHLQGSLQENLATFVNLAPATPEQIASAVASGDYQAALVALTPQYNNPAAVLSAFAGQGEAAGWDFGAVLRDAANSKDFAESVENYSLAEEMLLQEMPALPLFYETSYFAASEEVAGLFYSPFGGHLRFEYCR
ncbi:MAG TPA: peptide ABC transporter substrate-binding protein [Oscillospiraceae bacterium]|nr:peptide ABC transporter substrate-binding protein [Oscillospiraceae bacterium]HPW00011.1 peptide ABC transporter substrate-binding protein [Oscillospiraceae bacterium]